MDWKRRWTVLMGCGILMVGLAGCAKSSLKSIFQNDPLETTAPVTLTIWHESYDAAIEESRSTGKPILADFTGSDWCHWCTKLKNDVFETPTFKNWARDNVVLLELDYPKRGMQSPELKQQNAQLAQRYGVSGYPTVLFLNAEGEILGRMGYLQDASAWIEKAGSQLTDQVSSTDTL